MSIKRKNCSTPPNEMATRRNPLRTTHRKVIKERQTSRLLGFKDVDLPETDRKVSEGRFASIVKLFNVQSYLQNCVPLRQQSDKIHSLRTRTP